MTVKRTLSSILALVVLGTQCLFAYQPENNFWAERRKATRRTSPTLLASLPLDLGSVRANALTARFPTLQRVGSTLSPSVARSVPAHFSKDHAKILAALSPAYGTIRKVSLPKTPSARGPVVIHIQDVHMNQEAQWNIRETVKSLLGSGQVNLVALEGATEAIDLQAFVDYPHAKAVEMAADYLLKENKISGPIHAALTARGKLPKILGIDDPTHYEANVQAYRDSAPKLEKTHQELFAIQKDIEDQKRAVFSPALQSFDQQVQRYREGKSSLGEYVRVLANKVTAQVPHPALSKEERGNLYFPSPLGGTVAELRSPGAAEPLMRRWPTGPDEGGEQLPNETDPGQEGLAIRRFLEAREMERTLDFKKVEFERAHLIERLTQTLTAEETQKLMDQSLAYRSGHLRYADFYTELRTLCDQKGIRLKSFPALDSYVRYVLLADGIDAEQLMAEISALEKTAYTRQIKTPAEKSLVARSRQAWLTGKLVDFALTPTDWEEFSVGPRLLAHEVLSSFEDFYKEAHSRDIAMAKNLLHAMKEDSLPTEAKEMPVTLLVTGGFHAEGITQQLTQQGATVISYVPKIEKVDTTQGSTYLSVFTQEKSPLEKLFVGNKLFLANNPISRLDQKLSMPLCVTAAAFLFGYLLTSGDFSAAYLLLGGVGTLNSVTLRQGISGVVALGGTPIAFKMRGQPKSFTTVEISPSRKANLLSRWVHPLAQNILKIIQKAALEEISGTLQPGTWKDSLKGRLPMVVLGMNMEFFGPFSLISGVLLLLWIYKGIPQQKQFVQDHKNVIPRQVLVRSAGTFLLNVIAFSIPFFGDFSFWINAFLAGTAGAIGAHTFWNILAESGRKAGFWNEDYRLMLIHAEQFALGEIQVTRKDGIFGDLSNESFTELLRPYLARLKKIAPHIWFERIGGVGAELSRDRQHLYFYVPQEIDQSHAGNYIDKALDELEKYLLQPHAGLIYLIPLSQETGEFGYARNRLETIRRESVEGGQVLTVLVERPSYVADNTIQNSFRLNPNGFLEILFKNNASWRETFLEMQSHMEASVHAVEGAIRKGELKPEATGEETLLGWLVHNQVPVIFEEVQSDSQRLIFQSHWFLSVPFFWAPWPVTHTSGDLDAEDVAKLEKKKLSEVLAFSKSLFLREARLAEQLASFPISPRRAYVVIYGAEHLPFLPAVPGLTILPAQVGDSYHDLEIRQAMTQTLYDQLIEKCRETLGAIYTSPGEGVSPSLSSKGQRDFLSDMLEMESEAWSLLTQKTLLFSIFVQWRKRPLDSDNALRLSRLVEKLTMEMTAEELRQWTKGLLNGDPDRWNFLLTSVGRISYQDLNFLKTTMNMPSGLRGSSGASGRASSVWGTRAWEKIFGEARGKYYPLAAPLVATGAGILLSSAVWFLGGPALAGNYAFLIGAVFSLVFIASHVKALTPKRWRPKTEIPVDWSKVFIMAFLYGFSITLALSGLGGVDRFGIDADVIFSAVPFLAFFSFQRHGFYDGWGRVLQAMIHRLGFSQVNRDDIVANIPDLTKPQRAIERQILKNLDGRPLTLDMNQMRELVMQTAENVAKRTDSGSIDLSAPTALSSSGIKFMFVSQASLTAKGLENLKGLMARDENIFVFSEAPVPGISLERTVIVPFGSLPQGRRGNQPFREIVLTEVRAVLDGLAPQHPLRLHSSEPVSLFHTPDLQLNGTGLKSTDALADAIKNPMVLLLESFRVFPFLNQAWQDTLKALLALAEFA